MSDPINFEFDPLKDGDEFPLVEGQVTRKGTNLGIVAEIRLGELSDYLILSLEEALGRRLGPFGGLVLDLADARIREELNGVLEELMIRTRQRLREKSAEAGDPS